MRGGGRANGVEIERGNRTQRGREKKCKHIKRILKSKTGVGGPAFITLSFVINAIIFRCKRVNNELATFKNGLEITNFYIFLQKSLFVLFYILHIYHFQ